MKNKSTFPFIDNTDPNYPNGKIVDNDGSGNGTRLNFNFLSDVWEFFDKITRLGGITQNNLSDNESNGYQTIEALKRLPINSLKDAELTQTSDGSGGFKTLINVPLGSMSEGDVIKAIARTNSLGVGVMLIGSDGFELPFYATNYVGGDNIFITRSSSSFNGEALVTKYNMSRVFQEDDTVSKATDSLDGIITKEQFQRRIAVSGVIAANGAILAGNGFSVNKYGTGQYKIEHSGIDTLKSSLFISTQATRRTFEANQSVNQDGHYVEFESVVSPYSKIDTPFAFTIIGYNS